MISLTPWLQHLSEHLPVAREGQDREGVHQVRVAVRRLRVWLELAGMGILEDDLAWLVRGAGKVRDLEVLLGYPRLPKAFQDWAKDRLGEARTELVPMLDSARLKGLLQALSSLPPLERPLAEGRLGRFVHRVRRRAEGWERHDDFERLHALRRALRKLRYAREWLALDTEAIKELQDALGAVGDITFTLNYLDAFEADGGKATVQFRRGLETRLTKALGEAKASWESQKNAVLS
ncbi:MAG: metal-chelation protein CHAD [Meiothermus sp.]